MFWNFWYFLYFEPAVGKMILVLLVQFWFEMFTIQSPWVCLASGWTSSKYRLLEEVPEDRSTKVQLGIKLNSRNNVLGEQASSI